MVNVRLENYFVRLIDCHSPSLSLFAENTLGCPRYHRCKKTRGWKIQFKSHWKFTMCQEDQFGTHQNSLESHWIWLDSIGLHLTPVDFIRRVDLFGSIPLHSFGFHEIPIGFIGSLWISLLWTRFHWIHDKLWVGENKLWRKEDSCVFRVKPHIFPKEGTLSSKGHTKCKNCSFKASSILHFKMAEIVHSCVRFQIRKKLKQPKQYLNHVSHSFIPLVRTN